MPETKLSSPFEPAAPNRQLVEEHQIDPVIFPFDLFKFDVEKSEGYDLPGLIAEDGYIEIPVKGVVFTGIFAGENLSARDIVCIDAAGKVIKADKNTVTKAFAIGFSATAVTSGYKVRVVTAGKISGFAGLTPKDPVYLDDAGGYTQVLSGHDNSDYVVPMGKALSATEIEVQVGAPVMYEKFDSPTYTELQQGYTVGGGTKTPTPPTIAVCKPIGANAITIHWNRQLNLTNFGRYEIQVSDDEITWYDLEQDGSDWKGTSGLDTDVYDEFITHENIPHTGTEDNPAGRTLYYRVRLVTKEPIESSWSSSASATTNIIESKWIKQDAITSAKIINDAVIAAKIAASAVTETKLNDGAVTETKIGPLAITAPKIAANAVIADKILASAVTTAKLDAAAVTTAKLDALAVTAEKLAANAVETDKIAANAVTAAKVATTVLQAQFANVSFALTVGFDGTGTYSSPNEGDRRVYVDGDEIKFQVYTDAAWADERQITIGGVDASGNFRAFVGCSGVVADMTNIPNFDPLPNQSYYLFRLDNNLQDVDEIGSLTGAIGPVYTTSSKFGTHAITNSSLCTFGFLVNPYDEGEDFTVSIWYYHNQQTMGSTILDIGDASDGFDIEMRSSSPWNTIRCITHKGGTDTTITGPVLTTGWHHVALTYDKTGNKTYFIVDDEIYSATPSGTWGSGSGGCDLQVLLTSCRVDDYAVSFRHFCEPDYLVQHGNRGVQWESSCILSRNDLYLRSKDDGMVRAWDSPKRMLRHDFQSIVTTGAKLDELTAELEPGGYRYCYYLIVQSDNTGCGMNFGVNFTGSVDNFIARMDFMSSSGAASTTADDVSTTDTVNGASVMTTRTESTTTPNLNSINAVAVVDVDILVKIEGILFVTATGNLELWWGSELAAQAVRIYEGSGLVVDKLGPADF